MNPQLEEDLERLESWAQTLVNQIKSVKPFLVNILDGDEPLPTGCPSKGSLASMQFSEVRHAVREIQGAIEDVHKHF